MPSTNGSREPATHQFSLFLAREWLRSNVAFAANRSILTLPASLSALVQATMILDPKLMVAKFVRSYRRRKGIVGTLKSCAEEIEDIWFDRRFGVDTLQTTSDQTLPLVPLGTGYEPTKIKRLKKIFGELGIRYEDFIFLDVGSGKGRALLVASEFPFKRIIGVEFLPELNSIAEKNIRAYRSKTQKCRVIGSLCCNATDYRMPAANTVVFLSNPFEYPIVSRLMANLRESLKNHPRQIYVIYHNPVCHDLIIGLDFIQVVSSTKLYIIYKNKILPQSTTGRASTILEERSPDGNCIRRSSPINSR